MVLALAFRQSWLAAWSHTSSAELGFSHLFSFSQSFDPLSFHICVECSSLVILA